MLLCVGGWQRERGIRDRDICKLAAGGFGLRLVGGLDNIVALSYLGSAIVCIAIYKIVKVIKLNQNQSTKLN